MISDSVLCQTDQLCEFDDRVKLFHGRLPTKNIFDSPHTVEYLVQLALRIAVAVHAAVPL
jgi:hypothetical protein